MDVIYYFYEEWFIKGGFFFVTVFVLVSFFDRVGDFFRRKSDLGNVIYF